jgi:hypothetical protein
MYRHILSAGDSTVNFLVLRNRVNDRKAMRQTDPDLILLINYGRCYL